MSSPAGATRIGLGPSRPRSPALRDLAAFQWHKRPQPPTVQPTQRGPGDSSDDHPYRTSSSGVGWSGSKDSVAERNPLTLLAECTYSYRALFLVLCARYGESIPRWLGFRRSFGRVAHSRVGGRILRRLTPAYDPAGDGAHLTPVGGESPEPTPSNSPLPRPRRACFWACIGDLFGVGDDDGLTNEGVFHGGVEEEVGDVCARG